MDSININAWAALNTYSPMERSITACLLIMASNAAQAIGSQMFRTPFSSSPFPRAPHPAHPSLFSAGGSDAPRYLNGTKAAIALYYFSFILALVLWSVFSWSNRYQKGYAGKEVSSRRSVGERGAVGEVEEEEVVVKTFKYSV
jgi:hypothetical protein